MKSITQNHNPAQLPETQAQTIAMKEGFNCYSKLWSGEKKDFETPREAVFYYGWKGEILEVIILKPVEENVFIPDETEPVGAIIY